MWLTNLVKYPRGVLRQGKHSWTLEGVTGQSGGRLSSWGIVTTPHPRDHSNNLHHSAGHRLSWLGSHRSGQESKTTGVGNGDSPHRLLMPGLLWQRWWTPCPPGWWSWPCGHCMPFCTACHSASSTHLPPRPV